MAENNSSDGSGPKRTLDSLARGLRARSLPTAKMATKLTLSMAKRTFLGEREQAEADGASVLESASQLVSQMGELKGLVMKFGQMASYLPGAMPEAAQKVLSTLQSQSVAMRYERVAEVIEAELGAAPEALFESFERDAFAAASIGQVHRARIAGRDVAVKVQYPGIEELLTSDLKTISLFAKLGTIGIPVDGGELAVELHERTLEECDYLREAQSQELFRRVLSAYEGCRVPEVIAARSTRRVLTTALVDGARSFSAFVAEAPQALLDRAAERIFVSAFESIFRHCVFNADPHPGNYLFHDDGAVTFLDYGCVRRFEPEFIDTWKRFARSVQDGDAARFRKTLPDLGLIGNAKRFDWDAQWEAARHLYRPMIERDPYFRFEPAYVVESYGKQVFDNPNKLRMAMPRPWLLVNRLQWGLFAVLAHMRARAPWPDLFRAAIDAPTAPAY